MKPNYNELKVIKYSKNEKELEVSLGDSIVYINFKKGDIDQAPAAMGNELRMNCYTEIRYREERRYFGDYIFNAISNEPTNITGSGKWETRILDNTMWNGESYFGIHTPRVVSRQYNPIYGMSKKELDAKYKICSDDIIDRIEEYINIVHQKWNINEQVTVFDHQTITHLSFCGHSQLYIHYPNKSIDLNDKKIDIISSFSKIDCTNMYTGWIKIPAKSKDPKLRDIIDCFSFPDICNTFDVKSSSNYSVNKYETDTLTYRLYKINSEIDPIKEEVDKIHDLLIERAKDYDKYIKTI